MYQDSLGNSIPFQGGDGDFIKAMISSLKSPVKDTKNTNEMEVIRQTMVENTKRLQDVNKALEKLSQENKKILQNNSKEFNRSIKELSENIKASKGNKREHKDLTKLVKAGLKKGSIYTHDVRVVKHLASIHRTLNKMAAKMGVGNRINVNKFERAIDKYADLFEKRRPETKRDEEEEEDKKPKTWKGIKEDFQEKTKGMIAGFFEGLISKSITGLGGDVLVSSLEDAVGEGSKYQKIMTETYLQMEGMHKLTGSQEEIETRISEIFKDEYKTGLDITKNLKNHAKLVRMGIKDGHEALKISTEAGKLAYLMDLDAESTAELFGDWSLKLGLGEKQMGAMARSIKETGKLSGLMGDNLSRAVQASKTMMEYMRDIGRLSEDAADNILKMTAAGEKFGVGSEMQELEKFLGGGAIGNALEPSKYNLLFQRVLSNVPGLRGEHVKNNKDMFEDEELLKKVTKGFEIELENRKKLPFIQQRVIGKQTGMDTGRLEQLVKALQERSDTFEEKIAKRKKELTEIPGGVGAEAKKKALESEISDLTVQDAIKKKTKGNDANDRLNKAAEEMNKLIAPINEKRPGSIEFDIEKYKQMPVEKKLEELIKLEDKKELWDKKMSTGQEEANQAILDIKQILTGWGSVIGGKMTGAGSLGASIFGGLAGGSAVNIAQFLFGKWKGIGTGGAPATGTPGAGMPGKNPIPGGSSIPGARAGAARGAGRAVGNAGRAAYGGLKNSFNAGGMGITGGLGGLAIRAGIAAAMEYGHQAIKEYMGEQKLNRTMLGGKVQVGDTIDMVANMAKWAELGSQFGHLGIAIGAVIGMLGTFYDKLQEIQGINKQNQEQLKEHNKALERGKAARNKEIDEIKDPELKKRKIEEIDQRLENQIGGEQKNQERMEKDKPGMLRKIGRNLGPVILGPLWGALGAADRFANRGNEEDTVKGIENSKNQQKVMETEIEEHKAKMQALPPPPIEKLQADRAKKLNAEIEANKNQQLVDVASNTGDTADRLESIQTILQEILKANLQNGAMGDTEVASVRPSAPEFGGIIKNTRNGSNHRNMTYVQIT